jgi:hypothetical protein
MTGLTFGPVFVVPLFVVALKMSAGARTATAANAMVSSSP